MAKRVEVTEKLLYDLVHAQAKWTAELLTNPYNRFGDDWGDYTDGALTAMTILFNMYRDGNNELGALDTWLNTPEGEETDGNVDLSRGFGNYWVEAPSSLGCDGLCPELYELDCPALPKEF